jgi:hypothetical protein
MVAKCKETVGVLKNKVLVFIGIPFFETSTIGFVPCDTRQVPIEYPWSTTRINK